MFPQEYLHRCYKCIAHFDKIPLFSKFPAFLLSFHWPFGRWSSIFLLLLFHTMFCLSTSLCLPSPHYIDTLLLRSQFVVMDVFSFSIHIFWYRFQNLKSFRRQYIRDFFF